MSEGTTLKESTKRNTADLDSASGVCGSTFARRRVLDKNDAAIAFLEGKPDLNFLIDPAFANPWLENQPDQGIQR